MKIRVMTTSSCLVASVLLGVLGNLCAADDTPPAPSSTPITPRVKVLGLQGRAQFSRNGAAFAPLAPGTELQQGDVVRTASASGVDLSFKDLPPGAKVRLTADTTLGLLKVDAPPTSVELNLQAGELLAQTPPLSTEIRLEVKTSIGLARVLGGRVRVQSRGFLVVLDGKTIFAHVPPGGQPAVHTVNGPPPSYFTPGAGVQPAPRDLEREVAGQFKAKLKKQ